MIVTLKQFVINNLNKQLHYGSAIFKIVGYNEVLDYILVIDSKHPESKIKVEGDVYPDSIHVCANYMIRYHNDREYKVSFPED